ncbi:DUF7169 domain-containing protein [Crossiella sp. NPDC003009]
MPTVRLLRSARDLHEALRAAKQAQWEAAPVPRADTDGRRSQGGHADPTAEAALDDRRLALRAAVQTAEALLPRVAIALDAACDELQDALADWQSA